MIAFLIFSGGDFSWSKGPPGANFIMKKDTVIMAKRVATEASTLLIILLNKLMSFFNLYPTLPKRKFLKRRKHFLSFFQVDLNVLKCMLIELVSVES